MFKAKLTHLLWQKLSLIRKRPASHILKVSAVILFQFSKDAAGENRFQRRTCKRPASPSNDLCRFTGERTITLYEVYSLPRCCSRLTAVGRHLRLPAGVDDCAFIEVFNPAQGGGGSVSRQGV